LLEEFLNPMALTQRELAQAIHVPCTWSRSSLTLPPPVPPGRTKPG
jgi:hypothetical protein